MSISELKKLVKINGHRKQLSCFMAAKIQHKYFSVQIEKMSLFKIPIFNFGKLKACFQ